MKFDWTAVFTDAWKYWKRDRELLIAVTGMFLFLPRFALELFVPQLPALPGGQLSEADALKAATAYADWVVSYGGWMLLAILLTLFGALGIFMLYLGEGRPALRDALRRSLRLFPRYLLAAIIAGLPAAPLVLGLILLLLPCLYIMGRLLMVAPALVAERPIGVGAAIRRSFALTRGRGLVMTGVVALAVFTGWLVPAPFVLLHRSMETSFTANPVTVAMLECVASLLAAVVALATILVEVALYRALVRSSRGT